MEINQNKYEQIVSEYTDDKLINALKGRREFQKEATDAAIKEAIKRKLITDAANVDTKYPIASPTKPSYDEEIETQIHEQAKKDILYGGLWCVGGTVATLADVGFIFWGAIVFGGIQLIKGLINLKSS